MEKKGKLIVIEGVDGAGKETQVALVKKALENKEFKVGTLAFPRYNQTLGGSILYEIIKSKRAENYNFSDAKAYAASMPYTMDRYESKDIIEELLETNDIVLLDRYTSANIIHQGGKIENQTRKIEFMLYIEQLEYELLELPRPDRVILLSIPFEISKQRLSARSKQGQQVVDVLEKDEAFLKNSIQNAEYCARMLHWDIVNGVDSSGIEKTRQEVCAEILNILTDVPVKHEVVPHVKKKIHPRT